MISVRHLSKSFRNPDGTQLQVLRDVNCEIARGEVISIIGPSGSGKSTLLRALNMLDPPTGGEIFFLGENILAKGYPLDRMRRKMGMVFQGFNLFDTMTVLDNVTFAPRRLLGVPAATAAEEGIALLRKVGIADKASAYPDQLSGGQKQRVAIARCLAMKPEVILMDEPTSSLDPTMVGEVLSVIRQLARDHMTMLIVTHEMKFARDVSTRIFFMNEGIIYEDGTSAQIFDHPMHSATRAFTQRINKAVFDMENEDFDFLDMLSRMKAFCIKYAVSEKMEAVTHITEEMTQVLLRAYRPLRIVLSHSSILEETSLSFMIAGMESSPLEEEGVDEISLAIIRGMSRNIVAERTRLGFRIKVIL